MDRYETAAFKDCGVRKTQLDILVELSDLYPSINFRISDIIFIEPDMVITTITLMERNMPEEITEPENRAAGNKILEELGIPYVAFAGAQNGQEGVSTAYVQLVSAVSIKVGDPLSKELVASRMLDAFLDMQKHIDREVTNLKGQI